MNRLIQRASLLAQDLRTGAASYRSTPSPTQLISIAVTPIEQAATKDYAAGVIEELIAEIERLAHQASEGQ